MGQEYGSLKREFDTPQEMERLSEEISFQADEVCRPAKEHLVSEEFGSGTSISDGDSRKAEKQKKHRKTLRKMVYALASATMIVTLAGTAEIGGETQEELLFENPYENVVGRLSVHKDMTHEVNYTIYLDNTIIFETAYGYEDADADDIKKEVERYLEDISYDFETHTISFRNYRADAILNFAFGQEMEGYSGNYIDDRLLTVSVEGDNHMKSLTVSSSNILLDGNGALTTNGIVFGYGIWAEEYYVEVSDTLEFPNRDLHIILYFTNGEKVPDVSSAFANPETLWKIEEYAQNNYQLEVDMKNEDLSQVIDKIMQLREIEN